MVSQSTKFSLALSIYSSDFNTTYTEVTRSRRKQIKDHFDTLNVPRMQEMDSQISKPLHRGGGGGGGDGIQDSVSF